MRLTVNPFVSPFQTARGLSSKPAPGQTQQQKVREVAKEFEGLMIEQMVREMRRAVPKSTMLGREMDQELFNEMLDGELVKLMTDRGGIGLTDFMVKALSQNEK